jgi:DNA primase small subunit
MTESVSSQHTVVDLTTDELNGLFKVPMKHAMEDIILQYTYPRIDAEVSKHRNHLLKAPFCVHPKTGRICVPVDPETIDEFDPELVPTVGQLLRELNTSTSETPGEEHLGPSPLSRARRQTALMTAAFSYVSDWERTSLKPYVEMLEKHALGLMNIVRKDRIAKNGGCCDRRSWLVADCLKI